ncbi:unnamed protein product [Rangifer tarandus platyrhynchus]|uniref:Uncharacterized protein n=2 Tax=Rangifer tarandus platyrhynchus TaxID=3082113 RepID=A0ACB0EZU7_RANTA|nr:unnamed protein product [Rangifer tarandus platyrhynchus]CAI9706108.1 unnamed protein product [Rangifer tarandus platyrhynchus]
MFILTRFCLHPKHREASASGVTGSRPGDAPSTRRDLFGLGGAASPHPGSPPPTPAPRSPQPQVARGVIRLGVSGVGLFSKDATAREPLGCTISMTTAGAVRVRRARRRDVRRAPTPPWEHPGLRRLPAAAMLPARPPTWRVRARGARALRPRRPRSRRGAHPSPAAAAPPLGREAASGLRSGSRCRSPSRPAGRTPAANPQPALQLRARLRCRRSRRRRRSGGHAGPAPSPRMRAPPAPGRPALTPADPPPRRSVWVPSELALRCDEIACKELLNFCTLIGRWRFRP